MNSVGCPFFALSEKQKSHEKSHTFYDIKKPLSHKEVMVLKPDFKLMLRKKIPKYDSITGFLLLA